jgi:hypothetical protein
LYFLVIVFDLLNARDFVTVVIDAKIEPKSLRQQLPGGYGPIDRDKGRLPAGAAIFARFD